MSYANDSLTTYGDIAQIGIPLTAGAISLYKGDNEGFIQLAEGALYTAIATHALKFTVNAERPNGGDHSFPSGHTSAATQGAAYLQFRYGAAYGIPAYAAAALVGYSRVEGEYHHWRDVIAGMALATGIQYMVTEQGYSITVSPYFDKKESGLTAQLRF
ncbi:phosphatase PAP2 family protein [Vibrio sp. SCSIO 43136]|nr:phosphatase PAP2 family protein [Vibrio sp. SCSIO 43136]